MKRDIIEINNFIVLIEQSDAEKPIVEKCGFEEPVLGFAFYGSGNVELSINYGKSVKPYVNTKGIALSYFANSKVEFVHKVSPQKPLQCISIISTIKNLEQFPAEERDLFTRYFDKLIHAQEDFVEGPLFYMKHEMQNAIDKIFNNDYTGATRTIFFKSQITELLAHFFAIISKSSAKESSRIKQQDREKLHSAKEILTQNMATPPSLDELAKLIGLNNYKLKKHFKELFGVPVFKYLQNERLKKAHELLSTSEITIQEAAWLVGYESLSSFSSAFLNKFGFRPSEIKK
ncbi:MAG: helix-turn-helix transcriptional regulator [Aureispira sp.]|nr:helix-turn-helix transcriptional regulator [Aureispira sp.]